MTVHRRCSNRSQRSWRRARRNKAGETRLRFESLEERRLLVVSVSGAPNDDAVSLESYGGPGDPTLPGFDNVGRGSTGGSSVVYLGGGWVLTANHVAIANPPGVLPGGVFFGGIQYLVDPTSIHQLKNPDDSPADLKIFKIFGDPGLPGVLPSSIATAPPAVGEHVFMIGNGLSRGDQHFWTIDTSGFPWVWTEILEPPIPGPNDVSGYDLIAPRTIRWGENNIHNNNLFLAGVQGYLTQFDDLAYTGTASLTHEAQASVGDSGGPLFYNVGGDWVLSGIMIAVSANLSGQPASTTLFGFQTLAADLSFYRDEILSIAGVVGRRVFYDNSSFDGNTPGVSPNDDAAIATDKVAYLPGGGLAGPDNATSYSRGINGIMVDVASNHSGLAIDDFTFRMGANDTPSTWTAAPAPTGFTVRPGAGDGGSDRVEFIWADGAIANTWLEVTVEGNDAAGGFNTNTGLAVSDVFYFGNRVGDTFLGTPPTLLVTSAADEIGARNNPGVGATLTNIYDFNRDSIVSAADQIIARNNSGFTPRIDISSPPAAPEPLAASGEFGASAVPFALASGNEPAISKSTVLAQTAPQTHAVDAPATPRESIFAQLAAPHQNEWLADDADLDSEIGELASAGLSTESGSAGSTLLKRLLS